jgi:hypothetical protein
MGIDLAYVPRSFIPDQDQGCYPVGRQTVAPPGQKGRGDGTDRGGCPTHSP